MDYSPWGYKESDTTEWLTLITYAVIMLCETLGSEIKSHCSEHLSYSFGEAEVMLRNVLFLKGHHQLVCACRI